MPGWTVPGKQHSRTQTAYQIDELAPLWSRRSVLLERLELAQRELEAFDAATGGR